MPRRTRQRTFATTEELRRYVQRMELARRYHQLRDLIDPDARRTWDLIDLVDFDEIYFHGPIGL